MRILGHQGIKKFCAHAVNHLQTPTPLPPNKDSVCSPVCAEAEGLIGM